jgi:hypothetical protein
MLGSPPSDAGGTARWAAAAASHRASQPWRRSAPTSSGWHFCGCSGQAAALAGGTTMHIDFALPIDHDLRAGFEEWQVRRGQPRPRGHAGGRLQWQWLQCNAQGGHRRARRMRTPAAPACWAAAALPQAKARKGCMDYGFHMAVTKWSDKVRTAHQQAEQGSGACQGADWQVPGPPAGGSSCRHQAQLTCRVLPPRMRTAPAHGPSCGPPPLRRWPQTWRH